MTTSNKVSDRNPRAPGGLRRRHTIWVVAAPQRCTRIAVGAAPTIWRNAAVTRAIRLLPRAACPHAPIDQYRHNDTGEDNADAHIKRQLMGREVVVAVTEGRLDFGPWEQIFYGEFDGRRRKRVLVKIIGE